MRASCSAAPGWLPPKSVGEIYLQFRAERWDNQNRPEFNVIAKNILPLFDGGACFVGGIRLDYPTYASGLYAALDTLQAKYPDKPLTPCVVQAFDERPRWGFVYPPTEPISNFGYMRNHSVAGFKDVLTQARRWMDSRRGMSAKYMTIYAWNEVHEGGFLEPSIKDGFSYLKAVSEVFGLNAPGLDIPSCTFSATPAQINRGERATLTWTTQNATAVSINNGIGRLTATGSYVVKPSETTTYVLFAAGTGGPKNCLTRVTVN